MKNKSKSILSLLFIALLAILFATCEKDDPKKDPDTEYMEYTNGERKIGQVGGECNNSIY